MDYRKKRNFIIITIILIILVLSLGGYIIIRKINSKEYKLNKLGYTEEEIKLILNNEKVTFDEIINMDYDKNLVKIINEKYFIKSNLKKYLEYMKTDPKIPELDKVTPTDIVAIVNVGSNNNFYENPQKTDIDKGILMLVNKFNHLTNEFIPDNLIKMGLEFAYADKEIKEEVYNSFKRLVRDAKKEGLTIIANSSYRNYEDQEKIYKQKKSSLGEANADLVAARPGHSEHQTGLAIDVSTKGFTTETFDTTDEYKWLTDNAHIYGFILRYPKGKEYLTGFGYESWHYRYVGPDVAETIHNEKITFDEYYEYYLR